jgi:hypothetical protein
VFGVGEDPVSWGLWPASLAPLVMQRASIFSSRRLWPSGCPALVVGECQAVEGAPSHLRTPQAGIDEMEQGCSQVAIVRRTCIHHAIVRRYIRRRAPASNAATCLREKVA